MIDNILTNYNIKFKKSQIDHGVISKKKYNYKIYNNKISEPLHKFWFSVPNIKYSNNYSDFKTLKFFINNKNENILNLIDYIKDICNFLVEKFGLVFENITVDYPWKESEQYPHVLFLFTNDSTLLVDNEGNELEYDSLNFESTYSIIFEISTIKIMPIKIDNYETYTIKINLSLILIKQDEKKDLKKYLFPKFCDNNLIENNFSQDINMSNTNINTNTNTNTNTNSINKKLTFLNNITEGFSLNSIKNNQDKENTKIQSQTNKLIINTEQILKAINGLKKVETKKEDIHNYIYDKNNDNLSQINSEYLEQKNNLKKVKTKEKTFIKVLQKKEKKEKKIKLISKELELEKELERELERELFLL